MSDLTRQETIALLKSYDVAYYNEGDSTISDPEYDQLKRESQEKWPDDPYFKTVGAPVDGTEHTHSIPMGSLSNVNNEEEFLKWWGNLPADTEVIVQYKYDGLSLGNEYVAGNLRVGALRGDGITGELKTTNILNSWNTENGNGGAGKLLEECGRIDVLKQSFTGAVRGEGVIFIDDFNNHLSGESNPRNSAVGAIRKSNSPRARYVRMICYDIAAEDQQWASETDKLAYMESLGLPVAEYFQFDSAEGVLEFYNRMQTERNDLPMMVDGLVVKVNSIALQEQLGVRNDGRPRGMTAFKFECKEAETTLREVELAVGHTGNITLRGHYDEVTIDGRNFTHTNMDNFDLVEAMELAVGDRIIVHIAGDIIPKIKCKVSNGENRQPIVPPTHCPSCNTEIQKIGAFHKCTNDDCEARGIRKIRKWIQTADILYFGPVAQEQLYTAELVTEPAHMYTLTLEQMQAAGVDNAHNIFEQINMKRTLPLHIFLGGLGIPLLGKRQVQKLMDHGVDTLQKFLTMNPVKKADGKVYVTLDGQEVTIPGFKNNLIEIHAGLVKMAGRISNLLDAGVTIGEPEPAPAPVPATEVDSDSPVSGRTFCFSQVRMNGEEKQRFLSMGGTEKSGVSKALDYLVVQNPERKTSKVKKADKYREEGCAIQVISMADFQAMIRPKY